MKRIFSLILLTIGTLGLSMALPVDVQKAQKIATNFLARQGKEGASLKKLTLPVSFSTMYFFGGKNFFVIVAADDVAKPVLGYSLTNSLGEHTPSPELTFWLQGYEEEIITAQQMGIAADKQTRAEWDALSKPQKPRKEGEEEEPIRIGPLIETHWNQSAPYNDLCPLNEGLKERTVTGCVATAMAQIMRYWEYPAKGTGSHSYVHEVYGTQSVNFGDTEYDWYSMTEAPRPTSTQRERTAVATLSYHCGVAVNMGYDLSSNGGSGALTEYVIPALTQYFGYMGSCRLVTKNSMNNVQWSFLLHEELDNRRPIYYSGYSDNSGHAWVCDGYEGDLYHMNWGLGGYGDGYYEMGSLNPGSEGIGSGGSDQFNNYNLAVVGIEPPNELRLSVKQIPVAVSGDSLTIHVFASSRTANWTATTDAEWISLSTTEGPGASARSNLSFSIDTNNTGASRTATITINHKNYTASLLVKQYSCGTITELPFAEGFEGLTTSCWHTATQGGTRDSTFAIFHSINSVAEGDYGLQFVYSKAEPYRRQMLISPELQLGEAAHLSFQYRRQWSYNERMTVLYSTTDNEPESFIYYIGNGAMTAAEWSTFEGIVPAEARYVAICYENLGSEGRAWTLDDIKFSSSSEADPTIATLPYTQNFDNKATGWLPLSRNIDNLSLNGITTYNTARSASSVFRFSAKKKDVNDDRQYMISPRLKLVDEAELTFYYKRTSYDGERFVVLYSTTGSTEKCFKPLGDTINAESKEWTEYNATLPAETKYVAILYCPTEKGKFLYVDDLSLSYSNSDEPTGIESVETQQINVTTTGRTVHVKTGTLRPISFYTIDGRLIQSSSTTQASFTAPAAGIYLIKAGNATKKIVIL